jgi:murein DD-endopeptidase MepM/ murein hydrolase activator NlpD
VKSGTAIHAPCDGAITISTDKNLAGRMISIRCGVYDIQFMHLSGYAKFQYDSVRKGDIIGYTGGELIAYVESYSTGPHVHIQVKRDNKIVVIEEKNGYIYTREPANNIVSTNNTNGGWKITTYYSPIIGQAKYFNKSYEADKMMNCGTGDCLDTSDGTHLTQDMKNRVVACGKEYKMGTRFKITMPPNHPVHPGETIIVTCHDRGGAVSGRQLDLWAGIGTAEGYPWIGEYSTNNATVEVLN